MGYKDGYDRWMKAPVVLPAYNAARALRRAYAEIPLGIVASVILTDDASRDDTVAVVRDLGIEVVLGSRIHCLGRWSATGRLHIRVQSRVNIGPRSS